MNNPCVLELSPIPNGGPPIPPGYDRYFRVTARAVQLPPLASEALWLMGGVVYEVLPQPIRSAYCLQG